METTYNDIFNRSVVVASLPLGSISGKPLCDIIMLRVDLGRTVDSFNRRMEEGLKKLKEEKFPKFDEESRKEENDRCPEYAEWLTQLNSLYSSMRSEAAAKPVEGSVPPITRDILTAFCSTGAEGYVTFPGGTEKEPNLVPKAAALQMLAEMVEQ
ncbi:MAG: hypothetical protein NC311_09950 [Muribaculaceae bacterium]|nr:hypothetical protein [Muribaculaceae bacterium]